MFSYIELVRVLSRNLIFAMKTSVFSLCSVKLLHTPIREANLISIYVFIFSQLLPRKAATIGRKVYFHMSRSHTSLAGVKVDT